MFGGFISSNNYENGDEECWRASGVDRPREVCLVTLKKVLSKGKLPPPPHKIAFCHD